MRQFGLWSNEFKGSSNARAFFTTRLSVLLKAVWSIPCGASVLLRGVSSRGEQCLNSSPQCVIAIRVTRIPTEVVCELFNRVIQHRFTVQNLPDALGVELARFLERFQSRNRLPTDHHLGGILREVLVVHYAFKQQDQPLSLFHHALPPLAGSQPFVSQRISPRLCTTEGDCRKTRSAMYEGMAGHSSSLTGFASTVRLWDRRPCGLRPRLGGGFLPACAKPDISFPELDALRTGEISADRRRGCCATQFARPG